MPSKRPNITVSDFTPGLNTRDPAFKIPFGGGQTADNVWPYRGSLKNPPGHKRLTTTQFDAPAVLLDGANWMASEVTAAGSDVNLLSHSGGTRAALEFWFRADAMKGYVTLLCKGKGDPDPPAAFDAAVFDYWLFYGQDSGGDPVLNFVWSDGGSTGATTGLAITLGTAYYCYVSVIDNTGAGETQAQLIIREFGGAEVATALSTGSGVNLADNAFDLHIGANRATAPVTDGEYAVRVATGVIQELRFWSDIRNAGERDASYNSALTAAQQADADLQAYFPLTGSGPIAFADVVGSANDIKVEPTDHNRGAALVGTGASLALNGRNDGVLIPDSYLYRKSATNTDGEYPMLDSWIWAAAVRVETLEDFRTVWHYAHTAQGDFVTAQSVSTSVPGTDVANGVGTVGAGLEQAQACIDIIDVGSSVFQFRATVFFDDGDYAVTVTAISGGIVAGTVYDLLFLRDATSGAEGIKWFVDGAGVPTQVTTALGSQNLFRTLNDPVSSARKYHMTLGRNIKRLRKAENVNADPNDIDVEYDFSRAFDGKIDNLTIANLDPAEDVPLMAVYLAKYLTTQTFSRQNIGSTEAVILSHWKFDEAGGDDAEDVGQVQNPLALTSDPGHLRAASLSTTVEKDGIHALFEHRYVETGTGEVKKIVALTGAAAYEMNETTGAWTLLGEGLRNDDGALVQHAQFRNSQILANGSTGNGHLNKGELLRLSIAPPVGPVPWGLDDQNSDEGELTTGRYVYAWRFLSRITGKTSPLGAFSTVHIRCERANVVWGTDAEINQTAAVLPGGPTSADSGTPDTVVGSALKEPYDLSTVLSSANKNLTRWRVQAWTSPEEDGPDHATPDPAYARYRLIAGGEVVSDFSEEESMKNEEFKSWLEGQPDADRRFYWESSPDGTHKIKSSFVGSTARLKIIDKAGATNNESYVQLLYGLSAGQHELPDGGTLPGGSTETDTAFVGTGVSSHGQAIPFSNDSQVTHVQLCRTNTDGEELRVLAEYPNKTTTTKDSIDDSLNIGEIVDESLVEIPKCKYVTMLGDRYLFFGDAENPQRLYVTNVADPFNVPNYGLVDFYDGRTLELTAATSAEGVVVLFKRDMTFLLTPPQNPSFPFRVDVRYRDQGCTSPHGVASFRGMVEYPEDQGFFRFNGESEQYISRSIEPTWAAISLETRDLIAATHFMDNEVSLFALSSGDTKIDSVAVNDQVFAHFYRYGQGGWVRLTGMYVRFFSLVTGPRGRDIIYIVDHHGLVSKFDEGDLYGIGDSSSPLTTASVTVQAGTLDSTHVTVPQATLANLPLGHLGLQITLVRAIGGTRETRLVTADDLASPSVLTIDHAWTGATPVASTDTVLIGSVESVWRSGAMSPAGAGRICTLQDILFRKEIPTTTSLAVKWRGLGLMRNGAAAPAFSTAKTLSTTLEDDSVGVGSDQNRGDRFEVEVTNKGVRPGMDIHEMTLLVELDEDGSY